jgi:hypothetical protein
MTGYLTGLTLGTIHMLLFHLFISQPNHLSGCPYSSVCHSASVLSGHPLLSVHPVMGLLGPCLISPILLLQTSRVKMGD